MSDKFKVYEADIADFKPLPSNHNKHSVKGQKMVTNSMQKRGYARPAFAANDGTVLGGNLSTMEVAPAVGLGGGRVLVVETDGDMPIIHKRRDIAPDSLAAKTLSYEDNLTSFFDFTPSLEVFAADLESGFDFEAIDVTVPDLGRLLGPAAEEMLGGVPNFEPVGADTQPRLDRKSPVTCPECGHEFVPK
jgi:hypothetical protein